MNIKGYAVVIFFVTFLARTAGVAFGANFFQDYFESSDIGNNWTVHQNGGQVLQDLGVLSLQSPIGTSYPYVYITNKSWTDDNINVQIRFKFSGTTTYGYGINVSNVVLPNGISRETGIDETVFFIWSNGNGTFSIYSRPCPVSVALCANDQYYGPPISIGQNNVWYLLEINKQDGVYDVFLSSEFDTSLILHSKPSGKNIETVWLGDPQTTVSNQTWGNLDIDYIKIDSIGQEPTPTSTPTPTPTPDPTPAGFELPFEYQGRLSGTGEEFTSAFWARLTAAFDHKLDKGIFQPFTGDIYTTKNCIGKILGISCYDAHNGTDFSTIGGSSALSVGSGEVVYASEQTNDGCVPNKGGYGCVVIVQYGDVFGLYAHLKQVNVTTGNLVSAESTLGTMGNTGCGNCGKHLHFGVLSPVSSELTQLLKPMKKNDWKELLYIIKPANTKVDRIACTYRAPNGQRFKFQDPSGWATVGIDPWSLPEASGGCNMTSPRLWKY